MGHPPSREMPVGKGWGRGDVGRETRVDSLTFFDSGWFYSLVALPSRPSPESLLFLVLPQGFPAQGQSSERGLRERNKGDRELPDGRALLAHLQPYSSR